MDFYKLLTDILLDLWLCGIGLLHCIALVNQESTEILTCGLINS